MVTSVHVLRAALAGEVRRGLLTISIAIFLDEPFITLQLRGRFSTLLPYYLKLKMLVIWVAGPPAVNYQLVLFFCDPVLWV